MTDEQINIEIGKFCGYDYYARWTYETGEEKLYCTFSLTPDTYGNPWYIGKTGEVFKVDGFDPKKHLRFENCAPNYVEDLNAIHKAEERLNGQQQINYCSAIDRVVFGDGFIPTLSTRMHIVHATPKQKAEALLKTIGKWKDD